MVEGHLEGYTINPCYTIAPINIHIPLSREPLRNDALFTVRVGEENSFSAGFYSVFYINILYNYSIYYIITSSHMHQI